MNTATRQPGSASVPPSVSALARQARRRRRTAILLIQIALAIGALVFWEWAAGPRNTPGILIDEFYISRPTLVWDALRRWTTEGVLWISIYYTLETTVLGFIIGTAMGLTVGFILGVNPLLASIFQPFINALYSIPRLALVPQESSGNRAGGVTSRRSYRPGDFCGFHSAGARIKRSQRPPASDDRQTGTLASVLGAG